jgi:hypothetical protein
MGELSHSNLSPGTSMEMGVKYRFTQEIYEQCVAVDKKCSIVITKEEYDIHITILYKHNTSLTTTLTI